jgi:hypothetical protein
MSGELVFPTIKSCSQLWVIAVRAGLDVVGARCSPFQRDLITLILFFYRRS